MTQTTGKQELMAWYLLDGSIVGDNLVKFAKELTKLCGMTPDRTYDLREYPNPDGLGGEGWQLYFPWVESWLIVGTWPEHNLVRVALSTCSVAKLNLPAIRKFMEVTVGEVRSFGRTEW